ncbi:MAG TPA: cobalamin-dependent protein [Ktedonobacterales bacterium]|nr:cobalamin-dependent protein [Ktedonobacterales bacterium]
MTTVREARIQPPALDAFSDMPLFNTKAVVHQTGVPAPTLRAWERRYGILSPRRGENDYRLYSERDMMMVLWLRERVESGMTISQAIALLRSLEPARRGRGRRGRAPLAAATPELAPSPSVPRTPDLYALEILRASLLRQLASLDEFGASHTIAQTLAVYPVEEVCLQLFAPVLAEIGRRWAEGSVSVSVEHFASAVVRAQLDSLFRSAAAGGGGALVLVGCGPGELHELGALMMAVFLRRAGVRVAYLGQNVEVEGLVTAMAALRPAGVLLSVALRQHREPLAQLSRRIGGIGQPFFWFGGQAFEGAAELADGIWGQFLGTNALHAVEEIKRKLA